MGLSLTTPAPTARTNLFGGVVGVASVVLLSCVQRGAVSQNEPLALAAAVKAPNAKTAAAGPRVARGKDLFPRYCVVCHGETGDGAGKYAHLMNPRPRNLRQGKFRLSTTQNQIPSDEDLLRTINLGMPGSAMLPWEHLPLADRQALVKYVRQLHIEGTRAELKRGVAEGAFDEDEVAEVLAERTRPGPALVVPKEPRFGNLRWFRGRSIYLEGCASCHGADGNPVADAVKTDEEGFPVPPRSFVRGIFKGGSEGHQLYARIRKGMRGSPMPAYDKAAYPDDEMWDLIHYVQSLARAGAQERARLRQDTLVASKVAGPLPSGPKDAAWDQARPVYVALTPLWWAEDRIEGVTVRALHNGNEVAFRLAWIDLTANDRAVRDEEFTDGVAVQFALTEDPPFYMGGPDEHTNVNIWYWKADRQKNIASGYQDVDAAFGDLVVDMYPEQDAKPGDMRMTDGPRAPLTRHRRAFITAWGAGNLVSDPTLKTPVGHLVAHGPGTLAGKPAGLQRVAGKAVHERGVWTIQVQRSLATLQRDAPDERVFKAGDPVPVSFAVWDGGAGDRGGKKNISIWQKLVIE